MRIQRPTHNDYLYSTPAAEVPTGSDEKHRAWVDHLFNLPTKKCHECGAVMFGTMTYCGFCRFMRHKHVTLS